MDITISGNSTPQGAKIEVGTLPTKAAVRDAELTRESLIQAVDEADNTQATAKEGEQSPEQLEQVAAEMTDMMSLMRKGLAFKVDDKLGMPVVSVMDIDSGDLIRQIPSEEALELARKMSEVTGVLMKTEA
ncbi:flagellar protein FlaG [Shewanella sedimentimangrovi]|uniref:Flagellar protein FlaG n=1 Tax=Shewanella sedimentimangrovi TaxID=2814293 RepID=A0ABX7QZP4_9GAMM|nr:flagellar protein FlaG [Shewanella sedimentimangrovi]QSX36083.1 flagellar protein FlaG [Shewanella sedimentimangrovi]